MFESNHGGPFYGVQQLDLNQDGDVEFSEFREVLLLVHSVNTRALFDLVRRGLVVEHAVSEYTPG